MINRRTILLTESQIRRIIESNGDFGYHAGDLGASEYFVNYATSNRGTGHFGTGTYFVGNEDELNRGSYAERPHHKVDLSPYKLVKIMSFENGLKFHDALRYINNTAFKDYVYNGQVDEKRLMHECKVIAVMLLDIDDFKDLVPKTKMVYDKAMELIMEYGDWFKNQDWYTLKSDRRTISTELISSFGYDGVDCRGVPGLDNTMFGSVIYNMK